MPLDVGIRLGPYEIVAPIGAGGMGEVYRARDTRLKRDVAVKVLPAAMANDAGAVARFQREAQAVAALSHPNIMAIHDVGREGDISFFVCELLEGESLRSRLQRGFIPWRSAVDIGVEIAKGLAAAHAKGVIHRDLKPDNIFLTEGGPPKILDFGLARGARSAAADDRTVTLDTSPGTILGTTPYMSPEQVRGQTADARADVFAFGCMLFEMLTGRRAFNGATAADVMTAILTEAPPAVSTIRLDVPDELDRVVAKCLTKDSAGRYETAGELGECLEQIRRSESNSALTSPVASLDLPARPSLAVLPFETVGGDPEQEYFAMGLWTDINADLVKISGLFLVSQLSTGAYKGQTINAEQVGRELGVRHVLQGTVRRSGDRVRITMQLIDTQTGVPTWADRYDGQLDDLFTVQDRITESVVETLDIKLVRGESHRVLGRSLKCPRARDTYYRALDALFTLRREDLAEARCLLDDAAKLEPDSPLTHVFMAESHYFEATLGYCERPEDSLDAAMAAADRAIELGDPTGTAHLIQGIIQLRRGQHDAALVSSEQCVGDRPSCPWAYALQGAVHNYIGSPATGVEKARSAMRHTPLVPPVFPAVLATAHYLLGQYDEAVAAARGTLQLAPDTLEASVVLAAALAAAGRTSEAESVIKDVYRVDPGFSLDAYATTQPYKDSGTLDHLLAELRAVGLS